MRPPSSPRMNSHRVDDRRPAKAKAKAMFCVLPAYVQTESVDAPRPRCRRPDIDTTSGQVRYLHEFTQGMGTPPPRRLTRGSSIPADRPPRAERRHPQRTRHSRAWHGRTTGTMQGSVRPSGQRCSLSRRARRPTGPAHGRFRKAVAGRCRKGLALIQPVRNRCGALCPFARRPTHMPGRSVPITTAAAACLNRIQVISHGLVVSLHHLVSTNNLSALMYSRRREDG